MTQPSQTDPSRRRVTRRGVLLRVVAYPLFFMLLLLGLGAAGLIESLFFYPDDAVYGTPESMGVQSEAVQFPSRDGTRLSGLFLKARGPAVGTIIHSHGNAQNLTSHMFFMDGFCRDGFNVFEFDYRGFGKSEGKPSLSAALEDCHAALDYVLSRPDVDRNAIVWMGQSLGSALAVLAAAERPEIRAVAVESVFTGFDEIVALKLRQTIIFWPLQWMAPFLVSDLPRPVEAVKRLSPRPMLVIYGDQDRIIPAEMSRRVFAAAGEPRQEIVLPGGDHLEALDTYAGKVRPAIVEFFRKALEP